MNVNVPLCWSSTVTGAPFRLISKACSFSPMTVIMARPRTPDPSQSNKRPGDPTPHFIGASSSLFQEAFGLGRHRTKRVRKTLQQKNAKRKDEDQPDGDEGEGDHGASLTTFRLVCAATIAT